MPSTTIDMELCLIAKKSRWMPWRKPKFFVGKLDVTKELTPADLLEIGKVDDGDEIPLEVELECEYDYTKGTRDYFCSSMGNWHPGDPPDLEVESVMFGSSDIYDQVGTSVQESIDEKLCEAGENFEDEGPDYEPEDF